MPSMGRTVVIYHSLFHSGIDCDLFHLSGSQIDCYLNCRWETIHVGSSAVDYMAIVQYH
jgi:hypothetical protein